MFFSPTLTHAKVFYSRQLASYNYAIYDGATGNCDMAYWNELDGCRGVDEVVSVIMKSVTAQYTPLGPGQARTLVLWSDRCVGQTNNWPFVCMMIHFVQLGYFSTVSQKFLVSGHTYLPCDRCFGRIEERKKSCMVFTPDQWMDVIRTAQPSKPFNVIRVSRSDMLSYKDAFACLQKPPSLSVTKIAWIMYEKAHPSQLLTREHHLAGIWTNHVLHNPNQMGVRYARRQPFSLHHFIVQPVQKYVMPLDLTPEKKRDLREMMPYLEPQHQAFYLPHI